jgi:hypothetical protein
MTPEVARNFALLPRSGKPGWRPDERPARQPRPINRSLAFLDPLFARAALVVERDDPLGGAAHVGDDESDARNKLARVPQRMGQTCLALPTDYLMKKKFLNFFICVPRA